MLIHRALIKAYNMPDGGGLEDNADRSLFEQIGEHISATERQAVCAERETDARFLSAYMQPALGSDFDVKISGLTSAGIFAAVESLGAEGLIPMRTLPDDDYQLRNCGFELFGTRSGRAFMFGDVIRARLTEASPVTGGLIFKYVDEHDGVDYFEKGSRGSFRIVPPGAAPEPEMGKARGRRKAKLKSGKSKK